jgi:hypothetical protein
LPVSRGSTWAWQGWWTHEVALRSGKPDTKHGHFACKEKAGVIFHAENGSKTDRSDWVKFAQVEKGLDLDHTHFLLV